MSAVLAQMDKGLTSRPEGVRTKPVALVKRKEEGSPESRIALRERIGVPEKPQIGTPQVRPSQLNNNK